MADVASGPEGYHFHHRGPGTHPYWPIRPHPEMVSRVVSDDERSELALDAISGCGIPPSGWVPGPRWWKWAPIAAGDRRTRDVPGMPCRQLYARLMDARIVCVGPGNGRRRALGWRVESPILGSGDALIGYLGVSKRQSRCVSLGEGAAATVMPIAREPSMKPMSPSTQSATKEPRRQRGEAGEGAGYGTQRRKLQENARRHVELSIEKGFFCEAIAILESIIARPA
jgi:hypothetical protein